MRRRLSNLTKATMGRGRRGANDNAANSNSGSGSTSPDDGSGGPGGKVKATPVAGAVDGEGCRKFYEYDKTKDFLGKGNFSKVYKAIRNEARELVREERDDGTLGPEVEKKEPVPGTEVAVKIVPRNQLDANSSSSLEAIQKEIQALWTIEKQPAREGVAQERIEMGLKHIIRCFNLYTTLSELQIVMEYCAGGELFQRIVDKKFYTEQAAKDITRILLTAIYACHEAGVTHRDLKPENILLVSPEDDINIKIADFGFAVAVDPNMIGYNILQTACGTPTYVAPEVIDPNKSQDENTGYNNLVDIWSLGVIVYILLCGYPPFRANNRRALFKQIAKADVQFEPAWWEAVSDDAKRFVQRMLCHVPNRASAEQLLEDPWLQENPRDPTPSFGDLASVKNEYVERNWATGKMDEPTKRKEEEGLDRFNKNRRLLKELREGRLKYITEEMHVRMAKEKIGRMFDERVRNGESLEDADDAGSGPDMKPKRVERQFSEKEFQQPGPPITDEEALQVDKKIDLPPEDDEEEDENEEEDDNEED